jgi:hypothetical protein
MSLIENTPTNFVPATSEKEALKDIFEMFRYCRPMGSRTERQFVKDFIEPLGVREDKGGNLIKVVGDSKVLWSSHFDTVHTSDGYQKTAIGKGLTLKLHSGSKSSCLGGDCTAGVFIMREMIKANVPGVYVFHYGEEKGGIGSRFIRNNPEDLGGLDYAIAFDRFGTTSIITHQAGGRCCSEAFSKSLNKALGGGFKSDTGGSFTDTANYVDHIAECTNISVGYNRQHTSHETQDIRFLLDLRLKMIRFDESLLVKERKPGEREARQATYWSGGRNWKTDTFWDRDSDLEIERGGGWSSSHSKRKLMPTELERIVSRNPEAVASYIEDLGVDAEEVREWIIQVQGFIKY